MVRPITPSAPAPRPWWARVGAEVPARVRVPLLFFGLALFIAIVVVRGGPPPSSLDTASVVQPTTALADGQLTAAARQSTMPQPPGYPLLASPFVVVLRPWIGSPAWCSDRPVPSFAGSLVQSCAGHARRQLPPWYRSQAVLGILAWVVLAAGALSLLRAAGGGGGLAEVGLVLLLAAMPAASNGLVQTFHPQDLVCVGSIAAGLSQALRRRWVGCGIAFGVAVLCKQFAVLPLVATMAAASTWRDRGRLLAPAALVTACGVLPFLIVDPSQTLHDLGDTVVGGSGEITGTVVGITHLSGVAKLAVSRDGPIVLSVLMAVWARWRAGDRLLTAGPVIGLATACLATRLVFELTSQSYYLLAVSTALLVLDLSKRRLPVRSFAWVTVSSAWLTGTGVDSSLGRQATVFFVLSVAALILGLLEVPRRALAR